MNLQHLFARLLAPEGDLTGGGGAPDPAAGGGADAGAGAATPSMEDTARETYRALMESGEVDDATVEIGGDQPTKQNGRQHGPDGKFVKAATDGEQQAPAGDEQQTSDQQQQVEPKAHDAFPNTWRKDLTESWKALPENVREQVHRREQQFHDGIKQYKDAAGFGQSIAQEMLPYQDIMRQRGVTPQVAVRDIMGSLKEMVTGSAESKASIFLKLASDYDINWDTLMSLRQRAPSGAAPELSPVLQRVEKIETRITQADQEREQAQQREDERVVLSFQNDPKNEHARTVSKQMSALLMSGQAQDLQDAYDQAIWLHPEVRLKLLEKQEAERRKKEADEAAAAKKAAAANVHRRGTPPAATKPGSMEDTARAAYRKLVN